MRHLGRVVFLNEQGQVLAWAERTALLNADVKVAQYLNNLDSEFSFAEQVQDWRWERIQFAIDTARIRKMSRRLKS